MIEFAYVDPAEILTSDGLEDLKLLTSCPAVSDALSRGGWIAGGSIRAILSGLPLASYTDSNLNNGLAGDIDIFFKSKSDADAAVRSRIYRGRMRSFGGNASQFYDDLSINEEPRSITIQFVDSEKLCLPLEDSLRQFDFLNCMVAFDGKSIIIPVGWETIEKQKLLHIANDETPYLASRISKYMRRRGYVGVTPESRDRLHSWLVKSLSSKNFPGFEENRWSETFSERDKYGPIYEERVDWALNKINIRANCSI
jgi:hypothetical protein